MHIVRRYEMSDIFIPFTKVVDNYGLVNHTPEINTDEVKIIIQGFYRLKI